ncbi:MAG: hypothetical protein AAFO94_02340 [Bacteroidota bacterium]
MSTRTGLLEKQSKTALHIRVGTAFTIRNQLRTSIATVQASVDNKDLLNDYMQQFFDSAITDAQKRSREKTVIFGDADDPSRTRAFAKLLFDHQIKTYPLESDQQLNGTMYKAGTAYQVPLQQEQYRMVSTMFDPVTSFHDSVFYDASAWTVAMAYNMPYSFSNNVLPSNANAIDASHFEVKENNIKKSNYAYLIDWRDYEAAAALYQLLDAGLFVKTAFRPFSITTDQGLQDFGRGTLLVSVADQIHPADEVYNKMLTAFAKSTVPVYTVTSGASKSGIDLGSGNFRAIEKPKALMLIGDGTSSYETGEIWHLLDTRLHMPVSKVYTRNFDYLDLRKYNTMILTTGRYSNLGKEGIEKIKAWVNAGGKLICSRGGTAWAIRKGLTDARFLKTETEEAAPVRSNFENAREERGSYATGGSIYQTDLDITHPLGFGMTRRDLPVYRNHNNFVQPMEDPYSTVIQYDVNPLLGGYVHPDNLKKISGSASLLADRQGDGHVILFVDNPNFRGFWYGTNKLFFNALFFGGLY